MKNLNIYHQNKKVYGKERSLGEGKRLFKEVSLPQDAVYNTVRILGIDPGYALMGWGVIDVNGSRMTLINYGCVETKAGTPMQHRLRALQLGVRDLVNVYKPDDVAFEELFFAHNVTTALMVGAARGAAIIAATEYTENLYEYTPMQIKQAVTGYGKADKKQVQQMVKLLLHMSETPTPDDAADAIACAITHAQAGPAKEQFRMK